MRPWRGGGDTVFGEAVRILNAIAECEKGETEQWNGFGAYYGAYGKASVQCEAMWVRVQNKVVVPPNGCKNAPINRAAQQSAMKIFIIL